ncbi:YlbF family regulator [Agrilactobacillus yilanensis]|uniref:YlbF family regulator n=1 Tax=Agrilactobacillus yilanensis TaxID=2485997 RepID=A0ABW4J747_9LACO|nr:YlbF family regulator [Agrilactobacillus yilanensis]
MATDLQKQLQALEPNIAEALAVLDAALVAEPIIEDYQKIEAQVLNSPHLKELQADLKKAQRDIVIYQKLEKPKAAKQAAMKADTLKQSIERDPLTIAYRQSLYEADEILEHITGLFEAELQQMMAPKAQ